MHLTHAVEQDHLFVLLVRGRIADQAQKRSQASASADEIQVLARQQVVDQQRASGLAAHHNLVPNLDVLQARGERAVLHLDAEKLQVLFVIGAHDAVGAQQWLAVFLAQANHGEVAVGKPQGHVTRGGKAEQTVCPVVDAQYGFFLKCTHGDPCKMSKNDHRENPLV